MRRVTSIAWPTIYWGSPARIRSGASERSIMRTYPLLERSGARTYSILGHRPPTAPAASVASHDRLRGRSARAIAIDFFLEYPVCSWNALLPVTNSPRAATRAMATGDYSKDRTKTALTLFERLLHAHPRRNIAQAGEHAAFAVHLNCRKADLRRERPNHRLRRPLHRERLHAGISAWPPRSANCSPGADGLRDMPRG